MPTCLCACTSFPGAAWRCPGTSLLQRTDPCSVPVSPSGLWSLPQVSVRLLARCTTKLQAPARTREAVLGGLRHLPAPSSAAAHLPRVSVVESIPAFSSACLSRAPPHLPPQKTKQKVLLNWGLKTDGALARNCILMYFWKQSGTGGETESLADWLSISLILGFQITYSKCLSLRRGVLQRIPDVNLHSTVL